LDEARIVDFSENLRVLLRAGCLLSVLGLVLAFAFGVFGRKVKNQTFDEGFNVQSFNSPKLRVLVIVHSINRKSSKAQRQRRPKPATIFNSCASDSDAFNCLSI